MNAFVLLAIAAGIVLLIVEGAFLARLEPEQVIKITKRSVLAAIALVILGLIIMGKLHWIFAPLGLAFPFLDRIYTTLHARGKIRQWLHTWQQAAREMGRIAQQSREALLETTRARPQSGTIDTPRPNDMSREEAMKILGLAPGARSQDIKEAHRRLMRTMHPDRGGDAHKAAKVNRAKDVLLGD